MCGKDLGGWSFAGIALMCNVGLGTPTPRVFLQKSSELFEKKRVELLGNAKECARICAG